MSTLLNGDPILEQAYEKYQQFNRDEKLRALDEAHQRYLHDLATDIEAAHEKGIVIGFEKGEAIGIEKGEVIGEAKGEAKAILRTLTRRFNTVSNTLENKLFVMTNLDELERLADFAYDCETLAEFENALSK